MLRVIELIKNNKNWRDILSGAPYGLRIVDDGDFSILKFTYSDSDFNNEIVRECRGLIIDNKKLEPVCIPFFKFFNYGEEYAEKIDWDSAVVEEKIDGALIKVWNYGNEWMISTNNSIYADKVFLHSETMTNIDSDVKNMGELFRNALKEINFSFESLNPQCTYIFELVSPYNKLVIAYETTDVYHIGTRDNIIGHEIEVDIGIKKPKVYKCNNVNDLIDMASKLKSCEEGYVVRDKNFKRVKVKSPAYVAFKHFIHDMNDERIINILRSNEDSELLTYFPEFRKQFDEMALKIENIDSNISKSLSDKEMLKYVNMF
ncbi:hypothetical protein FACS1894190_13800 [Spirochaetia bacterium]|nr:hypothetical protein FACS1894190_13800 [Spirochaetia bacterium]